MTTSGETGAWRLYIGLDSADGTVRFEPGAASKQIAEHLAKLTGAGGCTIVEARGWFAGRPEPALVLYASGVRATELDALVAWICRALRQSCVGLERAARLELAGPAVSKRPEAA